MLTKGDHASLCITFLLSSFCLSIYVFYQLSIHSSTHQLFVIYHLHINYTPTICLSIIYLSIHLPIIYLSIYPLIIQTSLSIHPETGSFYEAQPDLELKIRFPLPLRLGVAVKCHQAWLLCLSLDSISLLFVCLFLCFNFNLEHSHFLMLYGVIH